MRRSSANTPTSWWRWVTYNTPSLNSLISFSPSEWFLSGAPQATISHSTRWPLGSHPPSQGNLMVEYDAVELNSVMTNLCLITWIRITEGEWHQGMALTFFFSSLISLVTRLQKMQFIPIIEEQHGDWGKTAEWKRDAYLKVGVRGWYVKNAKGHITYTELNFSKAFEGHFWVKQINPDVSSHLLLL